MYSTKVTLATCEYCHVRQTKILSCAPGPSGVLCIRTPDPTGADLYCSCFRRCVISQSSHKAWSCTGKGRDKRAYGMALLLVNFTMSRTSAARTAPTWLERTEESWNTSFGTAPSFKQASRFSETEDASTPHKGQQSAALLKCWRVWSRSIESHSMFSPTYTPISVASRSTSDMGGDLLKEQSLMFHLESSGPPRR